MKGIREYYDKTASDWAKKWYINNTQIPLLKHFIALLPEHPRILDLCCGAGYESMRLANLGAEVVGLDISSESIKLASEHNPKSKFYVGNMLDDYSSIGPVDGIVCIAGLVHIPPKMARIAFERMFKGLKTNGYILLTVYDGIGKLAEKSHIVVDGEEYDRAFYGYTIDTLKYSASGLFDFIEEIPEKEPSFWRNYIFIKI